MNSSIIAKSVNRVLRGYGNVHFALKEFDVTERPLGSETLPSTRALKAWECPPHSARLKAWFGAGANGHGEPSSTWAFYFIALATTAALGLVANTSFKNLSVLSGRRASAKCENTQTMYRSQGATLWGV